MGLNVRFAGLELENPVIVSSGPATAGERLVRKLAEMEPGAITMKSALLPDEFSQEIKPFSLSEYSVTRPMYTKVGESSYQYASGYAFVPAKIMVERIKRLKKDLKVPIIASQLANTIDGHVTMARMFESAGADAIEMDFCPVMIWAGEMASVLGLRNKELLKALVKPVKEAVSIPVGVKGSPDPAFPDSVARNAREAGADWIHVIGIAQLGISGIDIETGRPLLPWQFTSTSGPINKYSGLCIVNQSARVADYTRLDLTASGGIYDWRDFLEYIMYGCTTAQLCSGISKRGPKVIKEIKEGLLQYMERKGLERITDIRGIAHKYQLAPEVPKKFGFAETKGKIIAEVDEERCDLCEALPAPICVDTCPSEAIQVREGKLFIDKAKCEGVGLCVANCPKEAVKLLNVEYLLKLEKGERI